MQAMNQSANPEKMLRNAQVMLHRCLRADHTWVLPACVLPLLLLSSARWQRFGKYANALSSVTAYFVDRLVPLAEGCME